MIEPARLILPWPTSVNQMYRVVNNRPILSKKAREYKADFMKWYKAGLGQGFGDARISLIIYAIPPDRRKRDLDNTLKIVQDCLSDAGWYDNDCNVDDLHIVRRPPDKEFPHVEVIISEVDA